MSSGNSHCKRLSWGGGGHKSREFKIPSSRLIDSFSKDWMIPTQLCGSQLHAFSVQLLIALLTPKLSSMSILTHAISSLIFLSLCRRSVRHCQPRASLPRLAIDFRTCWKRFLYTDTEPVLFRLMQPNSLPSWQI